MEDLSQHVPESVPLTLVSKPTQALMPSQLALHWSSVQLLHTSLAKLVRPFSQ